MAQIAASAGGAGAADLADQTTLMIRNLPRRFTARDVVAELKLYVSSVAFDFVYAPWDRNGTNNVGYAFVNFVNATYAAETFSAMQGQPWHMGSRCRPVKVQPAHVQGLAQNLERFQEQGDATDPAHAPLVFIDGRPARLEEVMRKRLRPEGSHSSSASTSSGGALGGSPRLWPESFSSADEQHAGSEGFFEEAHSDAHGTAAFRGPPGLAYRPAVAAVGFQGAAPQQQPFGFRPPPGLEDVVPLNMARLPGYASSSVEVGALLQKLLAGHSQGAAAAPVPRFA